MTPDPRSLVARTRPVDGKVVPRVGALFSDAAAYRYLPRTVAYLPAPDVLLAQLAAAGFTAVDRQLLSVGISQLITATRA